MKHDPKREKGLERMRREQGEDTEGGREKEQGQEIHNILTWWKGEKRQGLPKKARGDREGRGETKKKKH
jgi:hypothetical protein